MKMFKKSISLTLVILMIVSLLNSAAFITDAAVTDISQSGTYYTGTVGECQWGYSSLTKVLTISGNGSMGDINATDFNASSAAPWSSYKYTSVEISEGVTSICSYAFYGKSSLKSVTIPQSVTSIGDRAFYHCSGLTELILPDNVTSLGSYAFYNCSSLSNFNMPYSVSSIGVHCFDNMPWISNLPDGLLCFGEILYGYNYKCPDKVEIPDYITTISDSAFENTYNLKEISIPDSVIKIGDNAFKNCTALERVEFGNQIQVIGNNAFENCTAIEKLNLSDSISSIGSYCFSGCSSLTDLRLPESLSKIEEYTFNQCSKLTYFSVPKSIVEIGGCAFKECSSLKTFEATQKLDFLGSGVFYECNSLEKVALNIGKSNMGNVFYHCDNLQTVNIKGDITEIGEYCFSNCKSLRRIDIPSGVEKLDRDSFSYCNSLEEIYIPETVKNINASTFPYCDSIKDVYYEGSVAQWLSINIASGNTKLTNANIHYYSKPVLIPEISDDFLSLKSGATKSIKVVNGVVKSYKSSNPAVATINNGVITALSKGKTTITAELTTGEELTCDVNVTTNPTVKYKNKSVKLLTVKRGKSASLKISGKAESVNNIYSCSKKSVAKVTSKVTAKTVKIKGYKKGTATVKIKVNGVKTFSFIVKVK